MGDHRLLILEGQRSHSLCIVGNRIEHAAGGNHSHSNAVDLRIHQVCVMLGGVHPERMNLLGGITDGDVLFHQIKMGTGRSRPLGQRHLAAVAMRDRAFRSHANSMRVGRHRQCIIPLQGWQSCLGAGGIGQHCNLIGNGGKLVWLRGTRSLRRKTGKQQGRQHREDSVPRKSPMAGSGP